MTIAKVGDGERMEKMRRWNIFSLCSRSASASVDYSRNGIVCNKRFCLVYCAKCILFYKFTLNVSGWMAWVYEMGWISLGGERYYRARRAPYT